MDDQTRQRLKGLPPLAEANGARYSSRCKVCGEPTGLFGVVDFNKHCSMDDPYRFGLADVAVHYNRCSMCGLLFTDFFDSWSLDDFSRFIYNDDYIKVDPEYASVRPMRDADGLARHFAAFKHCRILDYGSGSGALARRLKELGFDHVENYDPFTSPSAPGGQFDLITCFEVLEHSPDPVRTLAQLGTFLRRDGIVIFSTAMQPADIGHIRTNWWYVGPRNGHVSMFTEDTIALLGQRVGLSLCWGSGWGAYRWAVSPSGATSPLYQAAGRSSSLLILNAPSLGEGATRLAWRPVPSRAADWTQPEGDGWVPCRWTGREQVEWSVEPLRGVSGSFKVVVPFRMEVTPGFAAACCFKVGPSIIPAAVDGKKLVAVGSIDVPFDGRVTLHTPPLMSPAEAWGAAADGRRVGLAVAVPG